MSNIENQIIPKNNVKLDLANLSNDNTLPYSAYMEIKNYPEITVGKYINFFETKLT